VFRPIQITLLARFFLVAGTVALVPLLLVPALQGAEAAFGLTDKQAHGLAFYLVTVTSFVAFPRMRRNDLAIAAIALGAASEAAQLITGRDAGVGDLLADVIGVSLAWAPGMMDDVRRLARKHPGRTFAEIRAMDRRRRRRSRGANVLPEGRPTPVRVRHAG
jgi:VanZ family protein